MTLEEDVAAIRKLLEDEKRERQKGKFANGALSAFVVVTGVVGLIFAAPDPELQGLLVAIVIAGVAISLSAFSGWVAGKATEKAVNRLTKRQRKS
jgi:hypothetical protein